MALAAAEAAYPDRAHLARTRDLVASERARVAEGLGRLDFAPAPSAANFLFFDTGGEAAALARALRQHGVLIKPWTEPGYTGFARVTIGRPEENDAFLAALASAVSSDRGRALLPSP